MFAYLAGAHESRLFTAGNIDSRHLSLELKSASLDLESLFFLFFVASLTVYTLCPVHWIRRFVYGMQQPVPASTH